MDILKLVFSLLISYTVFMTVIILVGKIFFPFYTEQEQKERKALRNQ